MNTLGLSMIFKMGCLCSRDDIYINNVKYYIIEQLGQGGFSTVYLVEHSRTRRKYALKKIICHGREDQKCALQEVEYHKQLIHPNILPCLESCVIGCPDPVLNTTSQVLLLLPYYNKTLADDLETRSITKANRCETDILTMFIQICEGIKMFHEVKPVALAHRDIKPANVLIDVDATPIIMDLGSVAPAYVKVCGSTEAQRLQDIAAENCSMPYRAPELFNVQSYCIIDQRTDIWVLPPSSGSPPVPTHPYSWFVFTRTALFGRDWKLQFLLGRSLSLGTLAFVPTYQDNGQCPTNNNIIQTFYVPLQSLGCLLYAMCFYKSPYDIVYERGDSVALAVISGHVDIPSSSSYSQGMHDLIRSMVKVSPMERPYIYSVIEKTQELLNKLKLIV